MRTTRKTNQVDIDLSQIPDEGTRKAVGQLVDLVNSMIGSGIDTEGVLKARGGVVSGIGGTLTDLSFDSMPVMWRVVIATLPEDSGAQDHYKVVKVPGKVLGVCGWTQADGANYWRGMARASVTNNVYIAQGAGVPDGHEDTVVFRNGDTSAPNAFKAIIFYVPVLYNRDGATETVV